MSNKTKKDTFRLPMEKANLPFTIAYIVFLIGMIIYAGIAQHKVYDAMTQEMNAFMAQYDYEYDKYRSSSSKFHYRNEDLHNDITFWVDYDEEGIHVENSNFDWYTYESNIFDILERIHPELDFAALKEPLEQELSSKRYLEEDVDVKFREDINNPSFHLSASDVYEEDGYLLSIRPSESNISSAKEKMQ